jgi:short-subunit dehydrogenase
VGIKLRGAVVVITGASSGIGRATALACARKGANLVVAARREEPLRELVDKCERLGVGALEVPTDTSDEAAVQELARRAIERFGRVDVWVNNAGVYLLGRFQDTPPEAFRRVIETNLFGYVHGARAIFPHFRERGRGVLVNVASMDSMLGTPYASAYVASKFAVRGFAESLRQELILDGKSDVHICNVIPAVINTPLFQHSANYTGREIKAMRPIHDVDQVADTIVSLIERPRREATVGSPAHAFGFLHGILPGFVERQIATQVDRDHFANRTAAATPGNIYEPMSEGTEPSGEWRSSNSGPSRLVIGGVGALTVGVPAFLVWRARRRRTATLPLVGEVPLPRRTITLPLAGRVELPSLPTIGRSRTPKVSLRDLHVPGRPARRRSRWPGWLVPAAMLGFLASRVRVAEAPELRRHDSRRPVALRT